MSSANKKATPTLAETISKNVEHFNKQEVERLIQQFSALLEAQKHSKSSVSGMDINQFKAALHSLFEMTDEFILDRVFKVFDRNKDGFVSVEEWILGLSVFWGTLDEQIQYCFHVYDVKGTGFITREVVVLLLKGYPQPEQKEEKYNLNLLLDMTFRKMDHDIDGRLSFEDFEKSVKQEELALQVFGSCLPNFAPKKKFEQQVLKRQ